MSQHLDKIEMQLQPSSSSFDNLLPTQSSDSLVENELKLMNVYDELNDLGDSGSSSSHDCEVKDRLPIAEDHAYPCTDTYSFVPPSPPEKWPQRPILLRPSPESGMKIRGVRYSSSTSYLPLPGTGYCNGCTLPINNGLEAPGKCLVIDFESELFIGTAMLRVKNVCDPLKSSNIFDVDSNKAVDANSSSYFQGRKRTFQGLVRGRFKVPGIPMSECVTGQAFNHRAGHLPPRFIMKGAISIISHLAPQLQARLDGDCPRFLSPLVSTAQSAMSCLMNKAQENGGADESIEAAMSEPKPSDPTSLIQDLLCSRNNGGNYSAGTLKTIPPDSDSIATRIKTRKKAFDKVYANQSKSPTFDPDSEYTFEFFQHMLLFDEFALNFVQPIGKHPLRGMLNGQPLKFMAAHQIQDRDAKGGKKVVNEEMRWLWSFDLWHESLYKDALARSKK